MRIAYLGPAGTFTEDALREAAAGSDFEPLRTATVHDAILAVEGGEAERALVPFENSIEGSVRTTLDTLAFDGREVTIVGEHDFAVRAMLIAREPLKLGEIEAVLSHPQPLAQCARFLREQLPAAERRSVASTAEAVRLVSESAEPLAAIGAHAAADLYGCTILREGVEDEANNVTRFVWIAPAGTEPQGSGEWKTSLVFSELGEDHPGCAGRRPARVLQPRRQPEPDRVAAAAPGPRPLHVLLRPRGSDRRRAGLRGDRGAAPEG